MWLVDFRYCAMHVPSHTLERYTSIHLPGRRYEADLRLDSTAAMFALFSRTNFL